MRPPETARGQNAALPKNSRNRKKKKIAGGRTAETTKTAADRTCHTPKPAKQQPPPKPSSVIDNLSDPNTIQRIDKRGYPTSISFISKIKPYPGLLPSRYQWCLNFLPPM